MADKIENLSTKLARLTDAISTTEAEISQATASLQKKRDKYLDQYEELRKAIIAAMKDSKRDVFENDYIRFKYIKPTVRKAIDMEMLKKNHPQIYARNLKKSPVKESLRITVKAQD